jgi:AcrR family transcriptional regulator
VSGSDSTSARASSEARQAPGPRSPAGYPRSTGTERSAARQRELLDRVTDDIAVNGLVDFSLRRAARAAGTTHKVLLYHFDGVDDLLALAVVRLRERRIAHALAAAADGPARSSLATRIRAIWPVLIEPETGPVLDQAIGLAMYDPGRYAALAREASQQYLPAVVSLCPQHWSEQRRLEVAELILATLRGLLVGWRISGATTDVGPAFEALARALDAEEAADRPSST